MFCLEIVLMSVFLSVKCKFKNTSEGRKFMDVHIFRLHFDLYFPEIVHDVLLVPWFPFRAMGPDYLEQSDMVSCKIICHVVWIRTAISSAS